MGSSEKFIGVIGLKYFQSKVITLDYAGGKFAVTNRPLDYDSLDIEKYVVLPLQKTKQEGTGKNHSYIHNPKSSDSIGTTESNNSKKDVIIL